tara:strand:+ start:796 stop:2010 length:1215 start_codon:yes stop_codon:yes gene_type:complete
MILKTTNIVVNVLSDDNLLTNGTKKFSDDNLETSINLINKEAYPEYFGSGIPKGLELDDDCIRLIDNELIVWESVGTNVTQASRAAGKNPKYKQIAQDISIFGFKLRNIPILVKRNDDGTYTPINGRTRGEILKSLGFVNFICIVYKSSNGATDLQVLDAISKFGLKSNAEHDPAGDLLLEDVFLEGCQAIDKGYIKLTGNYASDLKLIQDRVNEVCGEGMFTDLKRSAVAYRILNNYSLNNKVLSWSVAGQAKEWVKTSKFKNISPVRDDEGNLIKRGLIYVIVATSTGDKSIMSAVRTAYENKDCDIRVLIHTGTLKGFDVELNYVEKIYGFRRFWDETLSQLSFAFFKKANPSTSPITLYGALPAVQTLGPLDKLKKFVPYEIVASVDDLRDNMDDGLVDL